MGIVSLFYLLIFKFDNYENEIIFVSMLLYNTGPVALRTMLYSGEVSTYPPQVVPRITVSGEKGVSTRMGRYSAKPVWEVKT